MSDDNIITINNKIALLTADIADIRSDFGHYENRLLNIMEQLEKIESDNERLTVLVEGNKSYRITGAVDRLDDVDGRLESIEGLIKSLNDQIKGVSMLVKIMVGLGGTAVVPLAWSVLQAIFQ